MLLSWVANRGSEGARAPPEKFKCFWIQVTKLEEMGKYHLSKSKGSKALRISSGALGGTDFQHGKII